MQSWESSTASGAYLVFIKFHLIKFTLFWQVMAGLVGFFGLLTILYGANYTQPFSIGTTVSGLTTQIEARVPGKVIEVGVKDNASVKKGDVLFKMDPQPYVDELHHAEAAYAEAQIRTSTAILQTTQTVNAVTAQVQAIKAEIQATQVLHSSTAVRPRVRQNTTQGICGAKKQERRQRIRGGEIRNRRSTQD